MPDAMSSVDRAALDAAYRRTRYVVPSLQLTLRVGQHHPDLDEVLSREGVQSWVFLSAANPYSGLLCDAENRARHDNLLRALDEAGYRYVEGYGEASGENWPAERSVLILGMDHAAAAQWAERFEQNAVVAGVLSGTAELLWFA